MWNDRLRRCIPSIRKCMSSTRIVVWTSRARDSASLSRLGAMRRRKSSMLSSISDESAEETRCTRRRSAFVYSFIIRQYALKVDLFPNFIRHSPYSWAVWRMSSTVSIRISSLSAFSIRMASTAFKSAARSSTMKPNFLIRAWCLLKY